MNVNKWYCDHCGKELDNMNDYIDTEIDTPYDLLSTDLCQDCVKKLWEVIGEFCSTQENKKSNRTKI